MKDYVDCCAQCPNACLVGDKDPTKWKVCCAIDGIERDYNAFCPHYNKSNANVERGDGIKVSRFHCRDCKYFYIPDIGIGMCASLRSGKDYVYGDDCVCHAFCQKTTKVKPRRLCDFCERKKLIDDEYGRYKIGCMKLIPLPAINLTTGETSDPKRNVEYSMFVYESDDDNGDVGSFPIKFCPYCGRKLGGEKDC